jgi:hypothetical protein
MVAIAVIISSIYFIPKRRSIRSTLDAVEFHMNRDADEGVVLDINGAFLQYALKSDVLKIKFTITSPNRPDSDYYTFVWPAFKLGDGTGNEIYSSGMYYNGDINGYTAMSIIVWFDPFRITIYQDKTDRYLVAPADNVEEAIRIKELSDRYLHP